MTRRIKPDPIAYRGTGDPARSVPPAVALTIETEPVRYTGLGVTPLNGDRPGAAATPQPPGET